MSKLTDSFEKIRYDDNKRNQREELLSKMTNEEIDLLIENTNIVQGKIYLSQFKKS